LLAFGLDQMGQKPQWKSGMLLTLKLTDIRQYINDLEVESLTYACPNIRHLDLSRSTKIKNQLICKILSHLGDLDVFVAKCLPLLSNIVLHQLATSCKKLSCLEIGACPNDYSDDISYEGIESLLMLKRPYGLKRIRIEYCTKIGDKAIQAISKRFGYCLEELSIIRNYYEKAARISDEAFKYL